METLIVERKDGVVTVTMNRPERKNAASGKMLSELEQIFVEIEANPDDRAMVLTGAGGAFCSGADLSDPAEEDHVAAIVAGTQGAAVVGAFQFAQELGLGGHGAEVNTNPSAVAGARPARARSARGRGRGRARPIGLALGSGHI